MLNEKIIETITIEGVDFEIIEKAKTIYAGFYAVAPDLDSDHDDGGYQWFQDNKDKIIDSITPECMIVVSIDYATDKRPNAILFGQETSNPNQPEGVYVLEAEPTTLIRVKSTDETWALAKKLIDVDNPQWHMAPLFTLIQHIFCGDKYGYDYEFNGCRQKGNEETEYYYFNGDKYVTVPVKKVN